MADTKISALTAATTPLAGTEVLPIVQSGTTKKVSVSDLTAGRATATGMLTASARANGDAIQLIGRASDGFAWIGYRNNADTATNAEFGINTTDQIFYGYVGGNEIYTLTGSSRDMKVSAGNLVIGTSGKGIDFSATPGTGTSELLADYEEGTWTPVLAFGGASVGITYAAGTRGLYTKIGNTVVVNALLELTNKGSSTGTAVLSGLPFTSNAFINYVGVSALYGSITVSGTIQPLQLGNTTNINLYEVTAAGVTSQLDNTDFANNSYVHISFTYQV